MDREHIYSISGAVLFYGMACTLLVAIGLVAVVSWTNQELVRDLSNMQADAQAAWEEVQEARTHTAATNNALAACRLGLVRYEAKFELVDSWVTDIKTLHGSGGR